MVAISENAQRRLTIQTVEIAPNTTAIRSLDWDRDRFDIEFGLQNGTTYNSYLIKGEKVVLVDTSHQKFRDLYLNTLKSLVNPKAIDYIIVSHTEPDHSGLVEDVLQLAPRATVLASKIALQFLENLVHATFTVSSKYYRDRKVDFVWILEILSLGVMRGFQLMNKHRTQMHSSSKCRD